MALPLPTAYMLLNRSHVRANRIVVGIPAIKMVNMPTPAVALPSGPCRARRTDLGPHWAILIKSGKYFRDRTRSVSVLQGKGPLVGRGLIQVLVHIWLEVG